MPRWNDFVRNSIRRRTDLRAIILPCHEGINGWCCSGDSQILYKEGEGFESHFESQTDPERSAPRMPLGPCNLFQLTQLNDLKKP